MVKVFLIFILMTSLFQLSGCGFASNNQQIDVNDMALAYMEQKYGEPFTYSQPQGDSMSGTREFLATCESLPGRRVFVRVENFRTDNKLFSDNYLSIKYEQETIDFFTERVSDIFGETIIYYSAPNSPQTHQLTANATFYEFLADTGAMHIARFEIKKSSYIDEQQIIKAIELLAEYGTEFIVSLIFVDDDSFGTFTEDTLADYIFANDTNKNIHAQLNHFNGEMSAEWVERDEDGRNAGRKIY